ncbi:MAG: MarR family transcriptional regulator [Mycobacteriaceae bacterium]|nr:MarR family transcriptional regulator [Mycobacteriaceae bacterium]
MSGVNADANLLASPSADLVIEWRELLNRHAAVTCALDKELQQQHGMGVSEFETLDLLVDAAHTVASSPCEHRYRMSDLTRDSHLSQSALSRAVARLERDGLVARTMCTDDRRSIFVCVTDAGRDAYARALPTHRETLARTLHAE